MSEITITLDEKACVGCSLCADVCPTDVFTMKDDGSVPLVSKPQECFGCLSCSEICPATAIHHSGERASLVFYHDEKALEIISRMGVANRQFSQVMGEQQGKEAMDDLDVRLLSVAAVLKQILGQSLPSIGTMAGKSFANQLPRYTVPKNLDEVYAYAQQLFAPAWELSFAAQGDLTTVSIANCHIRSLCKKKEVPLGGDLCILFYNYLAGYLSKIGNVRPRLMNAQRGESACTYEIRIYANVQ